MSPITFVESFRNKHGAQLDMNSDMIIGLNNIKLGKIYSEGYGLLLFTIGNILYGLVGFEIKYLKVLFPEVYDGYFLMFFRSLFQTFLIYKYMRYKNIEIIDHRKIENQFWLQARTTGQFLAFIFFLLALEHIRVGTASLITSMNPFLVVILASYILNEPFHIRYIFGIGICFVGSLFIVLNDKKKIPAVVNINDHMDHAHTSEIEISQHEAYLNTMVGIFWSILGLVVTAFLSVSSKILMKNKINVENQIFWLSVNNTILSLIFIFLFSSFKFSLPFIIGSCINGLIFIVATFFLIESIKGVDLSKTTPLAYCGTLFIFIAGVILLDEKVYLTDFMGCAIIIGYNLYNVLNPVNN